MGVGDSFVVGVVKMVVGVEDLLVGVEIEVAHWLVLLRVESRAVIVVSDCSEQSWVGWL